jgi:CheY-like chemotaxis protein/HPt (histidine-containing phosphotransfer) domain-containing protein
MMGGQIWVKSKKEKGSTFYFTLKFEPGKPILKPSPIPVISKADKSRYLLLVEDDPVNQLIFLQMLKKKGHRVDTADNGLEALKLFNVQKYDAILMDIQMPKMDGIEATQKIRELEGTEFHTPIIALTAYALSGDRERFFNMGMDEYLAKPVQIEQLFKVLDHLLDQKISVKSFNEKVHLDEDGELVFSTPEEGLSRKRTMMEMGEIEHYLNKLNREIVENNYPAVEITAHELKEFALANDVDEFKNKAFKIELALRRGDYPKVAELIRQIREEMETFKKTIF